MIWAQKFTTCVTLLEEGELFTPCDTGTAVKMAAMEVEKFAEFVSNKMEIRWEDKDA